MKKSEEREKRVEAVEESPELEALGKKIMEQHRAGALASNLGNKTPIICWMLGARMKSLGTCTRASATWRKLAGVDYVITIQRDFWDTGDYEGHEALVLHELKHVQWVEPREDDKGEIVKPGRWSLVKHDVEEFISVIAEYGPWTPNIKLMAGAMAAAKETAKAPEKATKKTKGAPDPLGDA